MKIFEFLVALLGCFEIIYIIGIVIAELLYIVKDRGNEKENQRRIRS